MSSGEEGLKQIPGAPIFGYGPGSYPRVLPDEARKRFINLPPSSWHNDMIETWLDSGPIAAAALGALVFLGVVAWMRGAWRGVREWFYRPGGVEGLLFICLVAFGLAGSVVTTSVLGLAFWFLLGLTLNPLTAIVRSS
jgi:O-antigen ligase